MKLVKVISLLIMAAPSVSLGFELGVNTHFGKARGNLDAALSWATGASVSSFRDELYWYDVEVQPKLMKPNGRGGTAMDVYRNASAKGIFTSLLLGYGNPLYDQGSQPQSESGIAAFADYSAWAARTLKGTVNTFEVWNEWNLGSGTRPKVRKGDVAGYVNLAKATAAAVRRESPGARIVVGALGDDLGGWPWATEAMKLGLLDVADVLSVHLYNYSVSPERAGADELVERLEDLQRKLQSFSGGRRIPIWVNEVGWPNHSGAGGVSEQVASRELLKFFVAVRRLSDVEGVWVYELFDGGDDPREREDNFGLLTKAGQEKPAGCRLRSVGAFMRTNLQVKVLETKNTVAYILAGDSGTLIGVWPKRRMSAPANVTLAASGNPAVPRGLGGDCRDGLDSVRAEVAGSDISFDLSAGAAFAWMGKGWRPDRIVEGSSR